MKRKDPRIQGFKGSRIPALHCNSNRDLLIFVFPLEPLYPGMAERGGRGIPESYYS
jgi:hypothetical protein